jgi:hypothetical protein
VSSHEQIHAAFLTHHLSGNRTAHPETKDAARAPGANPARRARRALVRRMLRRTAEGDMKLRVLALSVIGVVGLIGVERAAAAATNFNVTNSGASAYVVAGASNPTLTLTRGQTYTFTVSATGHPFFITTARGAAGASMNAFSTGVTNNGTASGTITFDVPASAPASLFYQCSIHDIMGGTLNIVSPSVPAAGPAMLAVLAGLLLLAAIVLLRKRTRAGS